MESHYVDDTLPPSTDGHFNFGTTTSDTQPITVFQTVWPSFPIMLPYQVNVPGSSYPVRGGDYAGVVVPRVIPRFYKMLIESPSPRESRLFYLDRSVFDLVDHHSYLALTDPKLLGWYLSLSPGDRKIIQDEGGFHQFLQRHPALELSSHHVYVKYDIGSASPAQPPMSTNKHTSRMSGAKTCRCEMPDTHLDLVMLPNNVRETLTRLGSSNSGDGSQKHPHKEICHAFHLQDGFQTAFNSHITQEPNHHMADKDAPLSQLHEERPSWQMNSSSSTAAVCKDRAALASFSVDMEQGQSANFTYAEVGPLKSEWPTNERDSSSVYTEDDDNEASVSFEDQTDSFHSVMKEDKSILVCLGSKDVKSHNSGPVYTNNEALAASSETLKSDQSVDDPAEKCTSTMPCVTTCDIMVGTELALCMSASTQTEDPGTSDKHVVTEVHMSDLDYLAEEFIKLKTSKEELREQKEKKKSLGGKLGNECDCIQRAQRAELCLLALQYIVCRQHCWRLYHTSAEGGQLTPTPKNPPANIESVLQKLEFDYNEMRDKILAGVPLEQLKPLSVDSEKITTGASYIPARIIDDVLGNVPSWSSQEPQKHNTSGEENTGPDDQSTNGCQDSQRKEQLKDSKERRAVTLVPQHRDAIHNANKTMWTAAACKELKTSEAWYDAEEDLDPAGPAVAAETGQDTTVITKDKIHGSASAEAESSIICVSNLPSNVMESDVMLWFEKYHASEVSISASRNDLRVAIVTVSGPESAEAAVRELNGCSMRGHTLHVERINKDIEGSHSQASASISKPESSQDQTSETDSISTERKLITQPLLGSSIKNRKVVCISPTAKGTCVPQHYGTMGSFDTLMAELTQRHPDTERQRIVDALLELKAKHQGLLSRLPLRTIREMTSELLTRPASVAQL